MCLPAGGEFVANWTLATAARQQPNRRGRSANVLASIAATCTDGTVLQSVTAPSASANFSMTIGTPIIVSNDSSAASYQDTQDPTQANLTSPNAYGFRAVWLPYDP